jgi:hypothetical protein
VGRSYRVTEGKTGHHDALAPGAWRAGYSPHAACDRDQMTASHPALNLAPMKEHLDLSSGNDAVLNPGAVREGQPCHPLIVYLHQNENT